jgi:hypothetical protein
VIAKEEHYAKDLSRLAAHAFFSNQSLAHSIHSQAIAALKNSFLNRAMHPRLQTSMFSEIIETVSEMLSH